MQVSPLFKKLRANKNLRAFWVIKVLFLYIGYVSRQKAKDSTESIIMANSFGKNENSFKLENVEEINSKYDIESK